MFVTSQRRIDVELWRNQPSAISKSQAHSGGASRFQSHPCAEIPGQKRWRSCRDQSTIAKGWRQGSWRDLPVNAIGQWH